MYFGPDNETTLNRKTPIMTSAIMNNICIIKRKRAAVMQPFQKFQQVLAYWTIFAICGTGIVFAIFITSASFESGTVSVRSVLFIGICKV